MSSSPLVPREKLSAYQRWELHSFDMPGDFVSPRRMLDNHADETAKMERARREAYESGRADGLRDGTRKSVEDAQRLRDLLGAVTQQSHDINQHLADDLLQLSIEVARQMVRRTLAVHPEIIVPLVKDALTQLGSTNAPLTITLHPSDAALVRTHLAESMEAGSWKILEDANLQRGGCLLQSATSHMDATVGTRWQHLTSRLGIEEKWLD